MAFADVVKENRDLRNKLRDALGRCAEYENNPLLKKALEEVARKQPKEPEKKVDTSRHPS